MIPKNLEEALRVLSRPKLTLEDFEAMQVTEMGMARLESEGHRATCRLWLAEANRIQTKNGRYTDPDLVRKVELAEAAHVERIRLVHLVCVKRKAARSEALLGAETEVARAAIARERDEARDASRRLAAEVERLQSELDAAKKSHGDRRLHQAFFEASKFILAESTFNRLLAKAKELAR